MPDPLQGPGGTAPDGTVFKLPGDPREASDYVLFTDVEKIFESWLVETALPNVRSHGPDALLSPSVAADFIGTIHQFGRRPGGESRYS